MQFKTKLNAVISEAGMTLFTKKPLPSLTKCLLVQMTLHLKAMVILAHQSIKLQKEIKKIALFIGIFVGFVAGFIVCGAINNKF